MRDNTFCVHGLSSDLRIVKLKGSQYSRPESLDHITKQFDEKTKRLFRDKKDTQFVPFGSPFDKDPAYGIRNGQLRLTG